jgi:hypothetical protein
MTSWTETRPGRRRSEPRSSAIVPRTIRCEYLPEPLLVFGDGGLHVDPKAGIARFGPRSLDTLRHPRRVRVGVIGTAETTVTVRGWLETNADGLRGNKKHPEFPGYQSDRGSFSGLDFDDGWVELLTQTEVKELLAERLRQRDRFERTVELLDSKLRLLAEQDLPPDYVVVSLPNQVVRRCKVADYHDKQLGMVHRDLRRAFKAIAMRYRIPTQLIDLATMDGRDKTPPWKIAWNFFTGLYFKAGSSPWGPHGLEPGTCYVGVSFYRPLGSKFPAMQTSLVQAFDEHGEGLVLRGHDFEWDPGKEGTRAPHLGEEQAADLVRLVLDKDEDIMKQPPQRVVVHKRSRYWPAERAGFEAARRGRVRRYDLMALESPSMARLLTTTIYPPLRGTRFSIEETDFLYTTGFIAALNEFHALHVPAPLLIADHHGQDTPRETLLREVLTLTKMNTNSANLGGLLPITLEFSRLVGEILREVPSDREPLTQFKFYT